MISYLLFIDLDLQSDWCPIVHLIFCFNLEGSRFLSPPTGEIFQHITNCKLCVTLDIHRAFH